LTQSGIRSLDAVFITDPNPERTAGLASLKKWVNVSTVIVCAPALWIHDGNSRALFMDWPLTKVQNYVGALSLGPIDVLQGHFPANWHWKPSFLERLNPRLLVETNSVSDFRPSVSPWHGVPL